MAARSSRRPLLLLTLLGVALAHGGQTARAEDPQKLRRTIKDEHAQGADFWIYNDIEEAMARARREDKPVFVTFRCVPCKACAAFDATVAQGSERVEKLARENFVAVRQVEMKGVDLSLFQFDHDLNWAAMFIHPDGVVYARYGTQSAEGPDAYNSVEGLVNTMRRVIELHEDYPENAEQLAGKRGPKKPYKTALEMPGLKDKQRYRGATTRRNCIHCHNIHDAENIHAQETGTFAKDMLWRYPLPENIGLTIDADDGIRIEEVEKGSPAAAARLRPGESVTHMQGQPMTSIADMQWVLHNLTNRDTELTLRGSETGRRTLRLERGWKRTDISWRGSLWSVRPRLRVWMPELTARERRVHGVPEGRTALLVKWINRKEPGGRSAYNSGLRQGDVVVAVDGEPLEAGPREFNMHVKLNYDVGQVLPVTVLRDGKKKTVRIRLVE